MGAADDQEPGDGSVEELTSPGSGNSSRPGSALPPTVLVTELDSGELLVQGRPDGPRVRLSRDDALPLRWELAAAFERTEQASVGGLDTAR